MNKLKKGLILTLIFSLFPLIADCTGYNFFSSSGFTANTHPAPKYANSNTFIGRGGVIYHKNTVAGQVGFNTGNGKKRGKACSKSLLWLFAWGDSSIERAKKNGNITHIASVDHEIMAFLGFVYHRHCTIITGDGPENKKKATIKSAIKTEKKVEKPDE